MSKRYQPLGYDELSEITGLGKRQLRDLTKAGHFTTVGPGKFDVVPTMKGWSNYQREQLAKKLDAQKEEMHALTRAKRMLAEEELAEYKGEYIVKSEIGPALRNLGANIRATLLRKYELELGPKLEGKPTLEIIELIRATNDDVIKTFADGTRSWLDTPPV